MRNTNVEDHQLKPVESKSSVGALTNLNPLQLEEEMERSAKNFHGPHGRVRGQAAG